MKKNLLFDLVEKRLAIIRFFGFLKKVD